MKALLLLFLCCGMAVASSSAQTAKAPARCNDSDIQTIKDSFRPETASKARAFVVGLQSAVRSDDREAVASMMHYPLRTAKGWIRTKAEFLKRYDEIWNKDVRRALLTQDIDCLSWASSGYTPESGSQASFEIGPRGEIWYLDVGKNDSIKVITINN